MEVDALETLIDGRSKPAFADFRNSVRIVQGAELVELTEERVELVESTRVAGECPPERAAG